MKRLPYRLKYDLYGMTILVGCVVLVCLLGIWMLFRQTDDFSLSQTLYLFFDFILPCFFSILVLLVFGRDFTKSNQPFIFSWPISMFSLLVLRYIRLLVLFLLVCSPLVLVMIHQAQQMIPNMVMSVQDIVRLLARILPNILAFGGLSLFLLVLFLDPFIPSIIVFGILLFDFCTFGKVLERFSPLVNYYGEISHEPALLTFNRVFYAALGLVGVILSFVILKYIQTRKH